jgi:hypothetical protein
VPCPPDKTIYWAKFSFIHFIAISSLSRSIKLGTTP